MSSPETPRIKRARLAPRRRGAPGAAPGAFIIDPSAPHPVVQVLAYSADAVTEVEIADPEQLRTYLAAWPVTWVNVYGLGDAALLGRIGDVFGLHPLSLEDVVHVHQRPKVEPYQDNLFIVLRVAASAAERLSSEQISMFLGKNFVLTFHERRGDCLDGVRERIRRGIGRIRPSGADHLAYAIIDAVVDHYFPILEAYGDRLESLEERVFESLGGVLLKRIHEAKHELLVLRHVIWPLRDAFSALERGQSQLISDETRVYLRDCYDHSVQLMDMVESFRESNAFLMDAYLSGLNLRANEVMKVLTVIATFFIPLTFIAGVYGMNFNPSRSPLNMPELNWYWGYPFALLLMAITTVLFLLFFRRRGWL